MSCREFQLVGMCHASSLFRLCVSAVKRVHDLGCGLGGENHIKRALGNTGGKVDDIVVWDEPSHIYGAALPKALISWLTDIDAEEGAPNNDCSCS